MFLCCTNKQYGRRVNKAVGKRHFKAKYVGIIAGVIVLVVAGQMLGLFNIFPNQAVPFMGSVNRYGGASVPYGTMVVYDGGVNGPYTLSSGKFTSGPLMTGLTYSLYFNGSSVDWANSWKVVVPGWNWLSGAVDANSLENLGTFTVYPIATAYTDSLVDNTYGGLSGASRANGGNTVMANDTLIKANVAVSFTYSVTVTSTFSARLFSYSNPIYPASGTVQGYAWIITNSTNVYLAPGSIGSRITAVGTAGIFAIPLSQVISTGAPNTIANTFSLIFPTIQHPTVYVYTIWNTNLAQLQASMAIAAPLGFTVGSFQLLGNLNAGHTYCLWSIIP